MLRLTLFGKTCLRDGGDTVRLTGTKQMALLGYLAAHREVPQPRDRLLGLLWGDRFEAQARQSLRKAVSTLNRAAGSALIESGDGFFMVTQGTVASDHAEFRDLSGRDDEASLSRIADLYRGEFMEGIAVPERAFETWLGSERRSCREQAVDALRDLGRAQLASGRTGDACASFRQAVDLDPVRDDTNVLLMQALDAAGRRSEALRHFDEFTELLRRELDAAPDPEGLRLAADLRGAPRAAPVATAQAAPAAPSLSDQSAVRYVLSTDGVAIATAEVGAGYPVVCAGSWLTHLERDWDPLNTDSGRLGSLARLVRLIRYDQRGSGMSDWKNVTIDFERMVDDLERVIDAYRQEKVALYGRSQGAAVSVAYAARRPERVSHLILQGGYARGRRRRGDLREANESEALVTLIRQNWAAANPAFRQIMTSLLMPNATAEETMYFNEFQLTCGPAESIARYREVFDDIDVSEALPKLSVPTLVLHSQRDAVSPVSEGRFLAARIQDARLVLFDSANHVLRADEPEFARMIGAIARFLPAEGA